MGLWRDIVIIGSGVVWEEYFGNSFGVVREEWVLGGIGLIGDHRRCDSKNNFWILLDQSFDYDTVAFWILIQIENLRS